jgi:hypothetical protein
MKNGLIINEYGNKFWYKDNLLHKEDGPAVILSDGSKEWWFEGKLHRTDGPAFIDSDGFEAWYLNGKQLIREEWLAALGKK